jgi:sugar lactone lactonase YvrE
MFRFLQAARSRASFALGFTAAAALSACSEGGSSAPAQPLVPAAASHVSYAAPAGPLKPAKKQRAPGHLYVSDFGSSSILEFATAKGKPAGSPSNSITGLNGPISIAFDTAGNLYESDLGSGTIQVFAPGASGNATPLRTLNSPGGYAIAVDANGYLYVDSGFSDVYVYAPGASGNAAPSFDINDLSSATSLAVAPNGDLYIADWGVNGALVYSTPETNPTLAGEFVDASLEGPIGIAFDEGEMYVVDSGNSAVKAYSTFIGPVTPDRVITSKNPSLQSPTDVASYKGTLYVTNPGGSSGPSGIFMLDPLRGSAQKPREFLSSGGTSGFTNPQDAQLGP